MDKLTIIGNLGQDPEMRYTPSGKPVANFSVASNRSWTGQDGEKHEQMVWYRISSPSRLCDCRWRRSWRHTRPPTGRAWTSKPGQQL